MIRLAAAVLAILTLTAAAPSPAPIAPAAAQGHRSQSAGHPVERLRALAKPQHLAQVQCPPPDANESFCGVYGNECIYCPSNLPHACLALNKCFETLPDAQAACGNEWVVCARPVG